MQPVLKKKVQIHSSVLFCFIILAVYYLFNFYLSFLYNLLNSAGDSLFMEVMILLVDILANSVLVLIGCKIVKRPPEKLFKFKNVSIFIWDSLLLCSIGFIILHFEITTLFFYLFYHYSTGTSSMYGNIIIQIIDTAVLPAIFEELFFKSIIFTGLRKNYSRKKAIIITSLLFALVHLKIYRIVPLFIFQYFSIYIYLQSGSLLLPMFLHFLNNYLTFYPAENLHIHPALLTLIALIFFGTGYKLLRRQLQKAKKPMD
jgi:membrane protease YdiL (CAAX protease family)